jgi:hypothetical protein
MRDIDGILYCNDGDWVESLTALVEHPDGRLEILDWSTRYQNGKPVRPDDDEPVKPGVREPELAVLSEPMAAR